MSDAFTPQRPALLPLEGVIRHYDWGSRTFLAMLRARAGRPAGPSSEPEAELWFGAHPTAPSQVRLDGEDRAVIALDELIARHPEILGVGRGGSRHELPFLLKILAAERPLSIQLHPSAALARAGFEREEAAGVERGAPERLYPDPNPKPEIACALTPFQALQGLRPSAEAHSLLASLECPAVDALLDRAGPNDPAALLTEVLALGEEASAALFDGVSEAATDAASRGSSAETEWVVRLADCYPGDPLVLAPLLLQLVELRPGEALFTPPGVIHSYLEGSIVELMGSSDNVLRAGLTGKRVDPGALLTALDADPKEARVLSARAAATSPWLEYPGTSPLLLQLADVDSDNPAPIEPDGAPSIVLALSGDLTMRSDEGAEVRLLPGDAVLVPAGFPTCRLEGAGRVYRAGVAAG